MAERAAPVLQVSGLNVHYGASHALQGVDLALERGVLSVVGRNGMGKTTLCKAIMGLVRPTSGSIRFRGTELTRLDPSRIAALGIGYVPQGRRLWPSLTVDEHLRLAEGGRRGAWTPQRVYETFPRLAERKRNRGGQLSGGEQQMLAISRALLLDPKLLVMDEPTEGLAPVIVAQVEELLVRLAEETDLSILIIEQNIGVATETAEKVAIMVNGRISRIMPAKAIAGDRDLQQRLLGVGRHAHEPADPDAPAEAAPSADGGARPPSAGPRRVYVSNPIPPTRWSAPVPIARIEAAARIVDAPARGEADAPRVELRSLAGGAESVVLVAGTLDTKGEELRFLHAILKGHGLEPRLVDLSTSGRPSSCDVPAHQVAAHHRRGAAAVAGRDRASSVAAMGEAFEAWIRRQSGIAGVIAAGGACGARIAAPGLRALPVGVPKVMISTVASGDVGALVGGSDILMMHSVADVAGLNAVSRQVLANGAEALAGMVKARAAALEAARRGRRGRPDLPAVAITLTPETTACVDRVVAALSGEIDPVILRADGRGLEALERLVESGAIAAVLDVAPADATALAVGEAAPALARFEAIAKARIPYVGALGGLDAVRFDPAAAAPERLRQRRTHASEAAILARLAPDEAERVGRFLAERLNRMDAPARMVAPERGLSALSGQGRPLDDPAADAALVRALEAGLRRTATRRLERLPVRIDDEAAVAALVEGTRAALGSGRGRRRGEGAAASTGGRGR